MLPLPTFCGRLDESWSAFEARLLAWLGVHRIQHDHRRAILLLALPASSEPALALSQLDFQLGFDHALANLRSRFGTELRCQQSSASPRSRFAFLACALRTPEPSVLAWSLRPGRSNIADTRRNRGTELARRATIQG